MQIIYMKYNYLKLLWFSKVNYLLLGTLTEWLSSLEMDIATQIQILDESVYISFFFFLIPLGKGWVHAFSH